MMWRWEEVCWFLPLPPRGGFSLCLGFNGLDYQNSFQRIYLNLYFLPRLHREATVSGQLSGNIDEELVVEPSAGLCGSVDEPSSSPRDHGSPFWCHTTCLSLSGSQDRLPYWCHKNYTVFEERLRRLSICRLFAGPGVKTGAVMRPAARTRPTTSEQRSRRVRRAPEAEGPWSGSALTWNALTYRNIGRATCAGNAAHRWPAYHSWSWADGPT